MIPRQLDFVARPRPPAVAWLAVALAAAAIAAAVAVQAEWLSVREEGEALRERLAQRARPAARPSAAATAAEAAQWRDLDAAARDLGAEWGPLLQHLAQHAAPDVAITQLDPDPRSGQLQVAGLAASPEAALAYAGRLAEGNVLRAVMLVSHETSAASPPPRLPVQFRIHALWRRLEH